MSTTAMKLLALAIAFVPNPTVSQGTCPSLNHTQQELQTLPCIIDEFRTESQPKSNCTTVDLLCKSIAVDEEATTFLCSDRSTLLTVVIRKSLAGFDGTLYRQQVLDRNRTRITACRSQRNLPNCVMYQRDNGTNWAYEIKYSEELPVASNNTTTISNISALVSSVYSCDCLRYGAFFRHQRKRCRDDVTWHAELRGYAVLGCAIVVLICVASKVGYDYAVSKGCHRREVPVEQ